VHFQVDTAPAVPKVFKLRLEEFKCHDFRLDFEAEDIYDGIERDILNPQGPVLTLLRDRFTKAELELFGESPTNPVTERNKTGQR